VNEVDCSVHVIVNRIYVLNGRRSPGSIDAGAWRLFFRQILKLLYINAQADPAALPVADIAELDQSSAADSQIVQVQSPTVNFRLMRQGLKLHANQLK